MLTRHLGFAGTCLALFLSSAAGAAADRESLLAAWEAHMASLPDTARFEAIGDQRYSLEDTALPYEGEVRVLGVLLRAADSFAGDFTHFGMVEFELVDLPPERQASQSYYYWLTDRQTLHYSSAEERWVDTAAYNAALQAHYGFGSDYGAFSFMLNYGIWTIMLGALVLVIVIVLRQAKKARALMDETAAINRQARENLDRAATMQDEALAVARQTLDLQTEANALLRRLVELQER